MQPSNTRKLTATNLGFPRIGPARELKWALEGYWSGRLGADELAATASSLRAARWQLQRKAGIDQIPSGDFSLYDHVLDTALMVGAVPDRFQEGVGDT
jgi:5-methyltetrahydropteroyltriglutamate--homocysteine methyltransferase